MKKIIVLLGIILATTSCLDDKKEEKSNDQKITEPIEESLDFITVAIDGKDFETCEEKDCPRVQVSYLKAENKPAIAEKINSVNENNLIKIFSSPEEEKPSPDNLQDAVKNFVDDYFSFKKEFPESPAEYEAEVSQNIRFRNDSLIVVETTFYLFTGGAHGYGATRYKHFNAKTGEALAQADLISDKTAFTNYAEKKFRKKFNVPMNSPINSTGFFFENNTFALPENMAFTNDSIHFVYNRYEAASYAEGELQLSLPKSEVKNWINY